MSFFAFLSVPGSSAASSLATVGSGAGGALAGAGGGAASAVPAATASGAAGLSGAAPATAVGGASSVVAAGPIAAGAILAYCIMREIMKARRAGRRARGQKYHTPAQVRSAAEILKNMLGNNGEALAVVDSIVGEPNKAGGDINRVFENDDFGNSPIRKIYSPPGRTNPFWAQQLATMLLDITGGNIYNINQFKLHPQEYIEFQQKILSKDGDDVIQEIDGTKIPWTEKGNKYIYINPETGAITGTIYFTVDPADRDNIGANDESPLITVSELNKYILDFKAKIIRELGVGYQYIYNTTTKEIFTDLENHGELKKDEKIITINADELYFFNEYQADILNPPISENSVFIIVGVNGVNDKALPKEASKEEYVGIPRAVRSHINSDLKTGYFYYKDPKRPPESHGIEGGQKNGDEAWHELMHLMGLKDRYFEVIIEDASNPDESDPKSITKPNVAAGDLAKENDYNYLSNVLSNGGGDLTGRQLKILLSKDLVESTFPKISLIHFYSFVGVEKKYDGIDYRGNPQQIKLFKGEGKDRVEYKGVIKPNMWYTPDFKNVSNDAKKLLYNDKSPSPELEWMLGEFLRLFIIINNLF